MTPSSPAQPQIDINLDHRADGRGKTAPQRLADEAPLDKWLAKLDSLSSQPADWPSEAGPFPTRQVLDQVRSFLTILRSQAESPSRLSPSVVGGIGVTFRKADRKAYVEFNNTGSVHVLFSDGVADPIVEKVAPEVVGYSQVIAKIKAYLHE